MTALMTILATEMVMQGVTEYLQGTTTRFRQLLASASADCVPVGQAFELCLEVSLGCSDCFCLSR